MDDTLKIALKMPFISAQKLTLKTTIRDINNKRHPAIDVFAHAIGYLQKHLLDYLNNRGMEIIHQHKIHWVLTIPAIWDDPAKQFMREAAKRVCKFKLLHKFYLYLDYPVKINHISTF